MTITQAIITLLAAIAMVFVVTWRRKNHAMYQQTLADDVVCDHLKPAWEKLRDTGHRAMRIGQSGPDYPMEIHIAPPFDPKSLASDLQLVDPVGVSERNVLFCKSCWCELHPER